MVLMLELCIMNNFKKMLVVCGNSVASTGASPWGYLFASYSGLGLVNSKMTLLMIMI